jgi:hypothetical protein
MYFLSRLLGIKAYETVLNVTRLVELDVFCAWSYHQKYPEKFSQFLSGLKIAKIAN